MSIRVQSVSKLQGNIRPPSSKSDMIRALFFALFTEGECTIHGLEKTDDVSYGLSLLHQFGYSISRDLKTIVRTRKAFEKRIVHVGDSGILYRYLTSFVAQKPLYTTIVGGRSLANRPIQPLLAALENNGAQVEHFSDFFAIKGKVVPGIYHVEGKDSQIVSSLLSTLPFLEGTSEIIVQHPGEKPWIDFSLHWLDFLGISYNRKGYEWYRLHPKKMLDPFTVTITADPSLALFIVALAMITKSALIIDGLMQQTLHPDYAAFSILEKMGAQITFFHSSLAVTGESICGVNLDINHTIDSLPILATLACFADSPSTFTGIEIARKKESNRVEVIAQELQKMGAKIQVGEDRLDIFPSRLHGAMLRSHGDHRIFMSLVVAAMGAKGESVVHGEKCVHKTYPHFVRDINALGGNLVWAS